MTEDHSHQIEETLPPRPVSPVRVAVVQLDPQVGVDRRETNLERAVRFATRAVEGGADLVVLPELASTGYSFETRAEAYAHAEPVPGGETVTAWEAFAREHGVYVVTGLAERDGPRLYDTAILVGPDGYIGRYRKTHLWYREKLWFTPGDEGYPVFDTPIGRIGLLICWDIWFPEVPRLLAQQGADIICSVNNWVWTPPPLFDETGKCMATYLTMTAAHVNNVFIAAADRVGAERGARFLGCSVIAGTNGWPLGAVAGPEEEEILFADVDLVSARSAPIWNELNDLIRDRRTDLYDTMLGYRGGSALPR
ncbi:nitrilase family protein [Streptosporangium sp. NPDC051023]|uniref:nitrilase family protein n=1 Tax=Streptosporangium sp. NPDC051023 TaxID=3155410 RepID=UPI0034509388